MQLSTGSVPWCSARVFDTASFVPPRLKCTASDSNTTICFKETSRSRSRREYVTEVQVDNGSADKETSASVPTSYPRESYPNRNYQNYSNTDNDAMIQRDKLSTYSGTRSATASSLHLGLGAPRPSGANTTPPCSCAPCSPCHRVRATTTAPLRGNTIRFSSRTAASRDCWLFAAPRTRHSSRRLSKRRVLRRRCCSCSCKHGSSATPGHPTCRKSGINGLCCHYWIPATPLRRPARGRCNDGRNCFADGFGLL